MALEEQKRQVEEAKRTVESERQKIREAEQQLARRPEKRIPFVSRQQRAARKKYEAELRSAISVGKKQLTEFERGVIRPAASQIGVYESQIAKIEEDRRAFEMASAWVRGAPQPMRPWGPALRWYKKLLNLPEAQRKSLAYAGYAPTAVPKTPEIKIEEVPTLFGRKVGVIGGMDIGLLYSSIETKPPLPAFRDITTGRIIYQTIRPEDVPKTYVPIKVDPTTLREITPPLPKIPEELTAWERAKAVYAMTPFGMEMRLPTEFHMKRETGLSKWISGLTWEEAEAGVLAQKQKEVKAERQRVLIENLQKNLEKAPEEKKYNVYERGLEKLRDEGVYAKPSLTEEGKIVFESLEMKESKSFNLYQYEREKSKVGKMLLLTRTVATEAVKTYGLVTGLGYLAGPTIAGLGRAVPAVAKVGVKVAPPVIAGVYGVAKVKEYRVTPPEEKPLFWAGLTGEIIGFTAMMLPTISRKIADWKAMRAAKQKFIIDKKVQIRKTPLSKTFTTEIKFEFDDAAIGRYAKLQASKRGINWNRLSSVDKEFVIGQVKAKIRNNPQMFLTETQKIALKRVKAKDLRSYTLKRLEGKYDKLTPQQMDNLIRQMQTRKQTPLTKTQKLALDRFQKTLEIQRMKKATKVALERKPMHPSDFLTGVEKEWRIGQIEAKIRAGVPLTKTQKLALERLRIKQAKEFALKRKPMHPSDFLTGVEKEWRIGQIEAKVRAEPERFVPPERRRALQLLERPKVKPKEPMEIITDLLIQKPSEIHLKAVARLKVKPKVKVVPEVKVKPKVYTFALTAQQEVEQVARKPLSAYAGMGLYDVPWEIQVQRRAWLTGRAMERFRELRLREPELIQAQVERQKEMRLIQKEIDRLRQKESAIQKQMPFLASLFVSAQTAKQAQKLRQVQKQREGLMVKQALAQPQLFAEALIQPQKIIEREVEITKLVTPLITPFPIIPFWFPPIKKERKPKIKIKPIKGWNVYGKVIKTKKYRKLNKVPLTKEQAQSLGAYLIDTSLSTNFYIKPTIQDAKKPVIKFPPDYFSLTSGKYRGYRIRKGKRIPMKDKWIEKKGLPRLDTKEETKKITLLKRLAKLEKRKAAKKPKKKPKKKKGKKKIKKVRKKSVYEILKLW